MSRRWRPANNTIEVHAAVSPRVLPRWQLLRRFWQRLLQQINKTLRWAADGTAEEPGSAHSLTHSYAISSQSVNRRLPVCQQETYTHSPSPAAGYRSQNHSPLINQSHPSDPVAKSGAYYQPDLYPSSSPFLLCWNEVQPCAILEEYCQMRRDGRAILVRMLFMETRGFSQLMTPFFFSGWRWDTVFVDGLFYARLCAASQFYFIALPAVSIFVHKTLKG